MTARIRRSALEDVSETDFAYVVSVYAKDLRDHRNHHAEISAGDDFLRPYPQPWTLPIVRSAINSDTLQPDYVIIDSRREFAMKMLTRLALGCALALIPTMAIGQSSPGLATGQVPTAAQWNSYFAAKQDFLGSPISIAGTAPISVSTVGNASTISLAACSASGQILFYTSSWACSATPSLGVAGTPGSLTLNGTTSGSATIGISATGGTLNLGAVATIDASGNLFGPSLTGGSAAGSTLTFKSTSGTGTSDTIIFQTGTNGANEGMRIVTAGQLVRGHTAALSFSGIIPAVQINTLSANIPQISQQAWTNDNLGSILAFAKSRGTTPGTNVVVQNNDTIGTILFRGADGSVLGNLAQISAQVDATPGSGDMPGRLVFQTTPDGSATLSERMRISNTGHTNWSGTAPALTSCGTSPAITGNDVHGTVTMGTATPTGCVITFALAYTAAPACHVTWRTNIASMQYTVSTTAITLTQTATSSNLVDYNCYGT